MQPHELRSETLRSEALNLRPLVPGDAAEMVGVLADPALYEFTGGEPPSAEALEERYRFQVQGPADGRELWFNWIIRRNTDGVAVGFVQATVTPAANASAANAELAADVAWVIGTPFQRNGYAAAATRVMCRWLHRSGIARITAHIHPEHAASQAVAAGVGMVRTGTVDEDGEEVWATPATA
ncbi:MAG: GNAT family N-acetyltransferase [Gemmatimonadetes bacterium]|nr:GNAT family N-acetyltransferase [Gemmatimonadota bacterium]